MSDKERILRVLENDAMGAVNSVLRVAQSDVAALLGEFMSVRRLDMTADKTDIGYRITIAVEADRLYDVGKIGGCE
ncbi:MAG: hypothetical protein NC184_06950 [Roseburia sp.]|nr:hypothetical protein [Roseburia sp.]